jgi:hypothetical protein
MEEKNVRKIVREMLKEYLEHGAKEKRYAIDLSMYIYAQDDEGAKAEADKVKEMLDKNFGGYPNISNLSYTPTSHGAERRIYEGNEDSGLSAFERLKLRLKGVSDEQIAYNQEHGLPLDWKGSKEGFYEKGGEGVNPSYGSNE